MQMKGCGYTDHKPAGSLSGSYPHCLDEKNSVVEIQSSLNL